MTAIGGALFGGQRCLPPKRVGFVPFAVRGLASGASSEEGRGRSLIVYVKRLYSLAVLLPSLALW